MNTDLGVAVFARTPGSGGKTRLAESWGRDKTDHFYQHCLHCASSWLEQAQSISTGYWALTGPGSRCLPFWENGLIIEQSENSLGRRMNDVAESLLQRHNLWCLVGTDIPQMPPLVDLQLPELLAKVDYVFGPATDGGFWLAAGRRGLHREVWEKVHYSETDTLAELMRHIQEYDPDSTIRLLDNSITDIDLYDDLIRLVQELRSRPEKLHPVQKSLLEWLQLELGA
ncbi:DUF2064 domain-containing protein [Desulfopila sp. IMCC35008]|uniref:TIGR04282 family arsenosugar biosynthesis glycosyltransferase n=1 Tax=Desulfopila sp. IMCC35008 TaxID=2653858 RepID=UPI0013D3702C|nr:DUF2064 domain-containing protein [Desulfopila sp. IMCC35008]